MWAHGSIIKTPIKNTYWSREDTIFMNMEVKNNRKDQHVGPPSEHCVAPSEADSTPREGPTVEKKKPGRPRKKVLTTPIEVCGIVHEPADKGDIMELVYSNPSLFKKLLQLYKQFDAGEIELSFTHVGLTIQCRDHLGKSNICTTIDGRCMNLYYCKMPVRIYVTHGDLERILGVINKNHSKITFILREDYRSVMYINIRDIEYSSDESYDIDVVFKQTDESAQVGIDDDTDYPVKFKVTSKHLKNKINNIRKFSQFLIIQKAGNGPVQLTFDKAQRVNFTSAYNDPDKIELKSTIADDDVFSVSVNIDYIRPFSSSNIGDDVYISADKTRKISFMTHLDKKDTGYACCVKIYTEIKDYRGH